MADSVILSPPQAICVYGPAASRTPGRGGRIQARPVPEHVCAWIKQRGRKPARRVSPNPPPPTSSQISRRSLAKRGAASSSNEAPQGLKDTNHQKLASLATVLSNQLVTWRERTNLTLEEFRAVGFASMLHVVLSVNSVVVTDLGATAVSCAERLALHGQAMRDRPEPRANALFEISRPLSAIYEICRESAISMTFLVPDGCAQTGVYRISSKQSLACTPKPWVRTWPRARRTSSRCLRM